MIPQSVRLGAPDYPQFLASITGAPSPIHVIGRIPDVSGLAIVGSRRPTAYGLRMARLLAAEAAKAGIPTVSGLARGVDTEVHRSTLDHGGRTWAVLGSGLGKIYPPENAGLADEIVQKGGAILSEFDFDEAPMNYHFPRRNRIISGLACATIVVEGDHKSGAMITAKTALDQGREVLAVPGPADSRLSEGPLSLLKSGAAMVRNWADVLEAVPMLAKIKSEDSAIACINAPEPPGGEDERKVAALLGSGETTWDELFEKSRLPVDRLAAALLELEMSGHIRSCPGQRYAKN